ncbi:hypothetical protein [Robbsia andropogonis]|uniref:hypothetical protein n=2 Tax=Robbsia andropogonis TaxID=28092 RepID=UPI00209EEE58|nr:hypothetical protein [Robbsia andropogonis]MCP1120744.1 hypothetical protein [Robbsia andropogonis]MCP1130581.1 hypothetical protein [Robbsia andropogonis]
MTQSVSPCLANLPWRYWGDYVHCTQAFTALHNVQNQNGLDVAFQSIVNMRQEWQPALLLERANIPLVDSDNIDWIGLHRRDTKINEMITWVTSKPESLWRATSFGQLYTVRYLNVWQPRQYFRHLFPTVTPYPGEFKDIALRYWPDALTPILESKVDIPIRSVLADFFDRSEITFDAVSLAFACEAASHLFRRFDGVKVRETLHCRYGVRHFTHWQAVEECVITDIFRSVKDSNDIAFICAAAHRWRPDDWTFVAAVKNRYVLDCEYAHNRCTDDDTNEINLLSTFR